MVGRLEQVITQKFSMLRGHKGVDLRCVDKANEDYTVQPCVAPENIDIIRTSRTHGVDGFGNHYLVYKGMTTGVLMKSIHVKPDIACVPGAFIKEGSILGYPEIGGNSDSLHEHFETLWDETTWFNPRRYFKMRDIKFRMMRRDGT